MTTYSNKNLLMIKKDESHIRSPVPFAVIIQKSTEDATSPTLTCNFYDSTVYHQEFLQEI